VQHCRERKQRPQQKLLWQLLQRSDLCVVPLPLPPLLLLLLSLPDVVPNALLKHAEHLMGQL
jgi:hypothetical protein